MAVKEHEIKFTWEDDNFFQMEAKPPSGDWGVMLHIAENTDMLACWPQATTIVMDYVKRLMKNIGDEMGA